MMKLSLGQSMVAVATTVIVIAVVAGVVVVGSPAEGRLERLDSSRIDDLEAIVTAMDLFWTRHERLAVSLEELADDPRAPVTPTDPGSGEPYGYTVLDEDTYELCAVFERESPPQAPGAPEDFWRHGAGRACFELDVDTSG